jgi:hypothetical protein
MSLLQTQNHEQKSLTSSQVTTLQVPTGGKIQSLMLLFRTSAGALVTEAQIRAELSNIRLTINGNDVVNASPVQILDLYETMGVKVESPAAIAGVIELNVGRLLFVDPDLRDLFGFGTADVANIQISVTAGTLSAIDNVQAVTGRDVKNQNLGAYIKYINYTQSFNGTGEHTVDTLPRDKNTSYLALLVDDGASGTITYQEIKVNNNTLRDRLDSGANDLLNSNRGYAQPAGYYAAIFADGTLRGQLPMQGVTDLRINTNFSVAPGAAGYNVAALTAVNTPITNV